MTPQEIIQEIQRLAPFERREVLTKIAPGYTTDKIISEDEVEQLLFDKGIIGKPPDLDEYTEEDEDFEPIEILGEPLSETIIRERR